MQKVISEYIIWNIKAIKLAVTLNFKVERVFMYMRACAIPYCLLLLSIFLNLINILLLISKFNIEVRFKEQSNHIWRL